MNYLLLLALSLIPGLAIVIFIYFQDKYEREPIKALATSFFYGFIALVIVFYLSRIFDFFVNLDDRDLGDQALRAFIVVSLIEESIKFLFLRGLIYYDDNFDEPFDGIVYSVMVGMGFATAENVVYVFYGGVDVAIVRMFSAVPAHATFAIIMGYFIGKSKFLYYTIPDNETNPASIKSIKRWFRSKKLMLGFVGLIIAIIGHGFYDYFLFISFKPGLWIGSVVALVIGIWFSKELIDKQREESPYKFRKKS